MFCSNCGTKLADGSKFCPKCGTKTGKAGSTDSVSSEKDEIKLSAAALSFFKKGEEYLKKQDFDNAILAFGKALKQEPGFVDAYKYRATAFGGIKKYSKAIKDLDKAIDIDPNNADLYYLRGLSYYYRDEEIEDENYFSNDDEYEEENESVEDNIEQAIMDFTAAIEINEKYIDAYLERANIYKEQKNYDAAIEDYSSIINIEPDNANHYNKRGWAYYLADENDKALSDFSKALGIDSQNTTAWYYRALTYHYLNNYEEAINDFTSALSLDSENTTFLASRGQTFLAMEKYEDALDDLNKAIEINPKNIAALSCRGNFWGMREQYSKGKKDYDKVLDLNPGYPIEKLIFYAETQKFAYTRAIEKINNADEKIGYGIAGEHEKNGLEFLSMRMDFSFRKFEQYKNNFGFILQSDAELYINKTLINKKLPEEDAKKFEDAGLRVPTWLKLYGISNVHTRGMLSRKNPLFYFIFDGNEKKVLQDVYEDGEVRWGEMGHKGEYIDNELKSPDVAIEIYGLLIDKLKYDNIYLLPYFDDYNSYAEIDSLLRFGLLKPEEDDDDEEIDDDNDENDEDDDDEDENDDTQFLTFDQIYDQGEKYFGKQDYKSAIESFEKIIEQCNAKIHAPEKIAFLYDMYALSKFNLFTDRLDDFVDEDNKTIAHKDIIFDHISIFKKALEYNPKESSLFYLLSFILYILCFDRNDEKRKEYYEASLNSIDQAIELDPNDETYKKQREDLLDQNNDLANQEETTEQNIQQTTIDETKDTQETPEQDETIETDVKDEDKKCQPKNKKQQFVNVITELKNNHKDSYFDKHIFVVDTQQKKIFKKMINAGLAMNVPAMPIILFDYTVFGSGKNGMIFTHRGIHYKEKEKWSVSWEELFTKSYELNITQDITQKSDLCVYIDEEKKKYKKYEFEPFYTTGVNNNALADMIHAGANILGNTGETNINTLSELYEYINNRS